MTFIDSQLYEIIFVVSLTVLSAKNYKARKKQIVLFRFLHRKRQEFLSLKASLASWHLASGGDRVQLPFEQVGQEGDYSALTQLDIGIERHSRTQFQRNAVSDELLRI